MPESEDGNWGFLTTAICSRSPVLRFYQCLRRILCWSWMYMYSAFFSGFLSLVAITRCYLFFKLFQSYLHHTLRRISMYNNAVMEPDGGPERDGQTAAPQNRQRNDMVSLFLRECALLLLLTVRNSIIALQGAKKNLLQLSCIGQ